MKDLLIQKLIEYIPVILQFIFTVIVIPVILKKIKNVNLDREAKKIAVSNRQLIDKMEEQNRQLIEENRELKQTLMYYISYSDDRESRMNQKIDKINEQFKVQAIKNVELESLARRRREDHGEIKKA